MLAGNAGMVSVGVSSHLERAKPAGQLHASIGTLSLRDITHFSRNNCSCLFLLFLSRGFRFEERMCIFS